MADHPEPHIQDLLIEEEMKSSYLTYAMSAHGTDKKTLVTVPLDGGMEAVVWTDVVQSVVLTGGALLCAGLLLFGMPHVCFITKERSRF